MKIFLHPLWSSYSKLLLPEFPGIFWLCFHTYWVGRCKVKFNNENCLIWPQRATSLVKQFSSLPMKCTLSLRDCTKVDANCRSDKHLVVLTGEVRKDLGRENDTVLFLTRKGIQRKDNVQKTQKHKACPFLPELLLTDTVCLASSLSRCHSSSTVLFSCSNW